MQSLPLARSVGNVSGEAITLSNIGYLKFNQQHYSQASQYLMQAIELFESINQGNLGDSLKISHFDTYADNYSLLQQIFVAQKQYDSALEIAERGRARALIELLNNQR